MVSEIRNMGGLRAPVAPAAAPLQRGAALQTEAAAPRVTAPKPVQIMFDPVKMRQNVSDAVHMLNQQMQANGRGLGFSVDEAIGGPVVTVRDSNSGEVVRQIPNEAVIRVAHSIDAIKGLLFTGKA